MIRSDWWAVVLVVPALALPGGRPQGPPLRTGSDPVASKLQPGMQLVYGTPGGAMQPAWTVDSVETGRIIEGRTDCARVFIRRRPDQPAPEARLCVSGDTLFGWDTRARAWQPQRPIGAGMTMVFRRPNGDTVRYTTAELGQQVVSDMMLEIVATTVLTVDSLGRPRRRLVESYSPGLTTATGGEFSVPDSTATGGWRSENRFALMQIRRAP